jgi:nitric oxide reductase subunit B
MVAGFSTLGYLAARTYRDAPPIPARVVDPAGTTLFTQQDISAGQQVFLSHGLMENGSIWGHGAYLGPDFSAGYLHTLALDVLAARSTMVSRSSAAIAQTTRMSRTSRWRTSSKRIVIIRNRIR